MPEQPPISSLAPDRIALHRLLYLLLPALERRGFVFSPDRYMGLLRLLDALPEDMLLEQWRSWLCPLLATSPEQQRQFYEWFDSCVRQVRAEIETYTTEDAPASGQSEPEGPAEVPEPVPVVPPVVPPVAPTAPIAPVLPAERRPLVVELEECTEPPFSWNIVPDSEGIPIDAGPQLSRTLLQLRRREWAEHIEFDLEATIRATLAEGGVPTFRYRTSTRPTEYLLLVERYAADDHRAALFDHFYRTLRRSEVLIERFFYTGDLRLCRSERYPAGLTLDQLHYRYPHARLVVVGTGYRFIRPRTGELAEWTRALLNWRRRVLLTPVPRQQWGAREHALEQRFFLLPAALSSLHYLSGAPDEALHGRYEALPEYVRRVAETQPIALEPPYLRALRQHFDPGALCWVAACAVYPALHFELTLRIGRLLSGSLGHNLLSAARLLALARLNWFTQGRIPYEARTELIEWLEHRHPDQHQQVLEYLCNLMEQNPPPENSMAWAEHQINLALLRAVREPQLDANTAEQLRAVVKRLQRPQQRGDFVLPKNWESILEKIGFADDSDLPETNDSLHPELVVANTYRLQQRIGQSELAETWQATDLRNGQTVALKVFQSGETYFQYCQRDFALNSQLWHPNLLHLRAYGFWNNQPWQEMPLGQPIEPGSIQDENTLWRILHDIASALAYLHAAQLTHNYLTPSQILHRSDGFGYVLADTGRCGKLLSAAASDGIPLTLYHAHLVPPERRKKPLLTSPAADIYTLAASLYYLATGQAPYTREADQTARLPKAFEALFSACLSAQPKDRPSAAQLQQRALETLRKRDVPPPEYFKPDMVFVRGGTFDMGCTREQRDCYSDEKPVTRVTVRDFYIGRYAVTFEEYDAFCAATGRHKPSDLGWGRGRRPVINVSWYDAVEYCNWLSEREGLRPVYRIDRQRKDPNNRDNYDDLKWAVTLNESANGYRLPTEAEWEYAARGGYQSKGYLYSGSDDLDEVAWYDNNSGGKTHPVGQKKANELGLYDMSGNVWEWCWDWYGAYPGGSQVGYRGPGSGFYRVYRGGSWYGDARYCRVAYRDYGGPSDRDNYFGFRLAL